MHFFATLFCLLGLTTHHVRGDIVSDALSATPIATISDGTISGTTKSITYTPPGPSAKPTTIAVNNFLGIPYAAPPTGTAGRFTPPTPPAKWTKTLDATKFKAPCMQNFAPAAFRPFTEQVFNTPRPPVDPSEDCLYLNVFTPKKKWDPSKPSYPVMYWIFGGGFKFGTATLPYYDGSQFAALEDVIIVSVGYRTNAFGLPQTPSIKNATERNLAMLDQLAGLRWVHDNIAAFGGDKDKVTIFGQSAGGTSVDMLVTGYPQDWTPLFRAAIMQSGVFAYLPLPPCNWTGFAVWDKLVNATGCNATNVEATQFACMKNLPAQKIIDAQEADLSIAFLQANQCDNRTVVADPRNRMTNGIFNKVPVMIGSDTQDGSFYADFYRTLTFDYYWGGNSFPFDDFYNQVKAAYGVGSPSDSDYMDKLTQIATDWNFHCPAVFRAAASASYVTTYRYLFNATFPNTRIRNDLWPEQDQGAYHTSEIPIIFNTWNRSTETLPERELGDKMRKAWAAFARDPSTPPTTDWKEATKDGSWAMVFGGKNDSSTKMVQETGKCETLWRKWSLENWRP